MLRDPGISVEDRLVLYWIRVGPSMIILIFVAKPVKS